MTALTYQEWLYEREESRKVRAAIERITGRPMGLIQLHGLRRVA